MGETHGLEHVPSIWKQPALRAGEAIRQARREGRCGYIGRAAQRSGRPPARNPEGRALLRRGFVEGLARSSCYATSPFSCPRPQNRSGAGVPIWKEHALTDMAQKPLVIVTRRLPDSIEARMAA